MDTSQDSTTEESLSAFGSSAVPRSVPPSSSSASASASPSSSAMSISVQTQERSRAEDPMGDWEEVDSPTKRQKAEKAESGTHLELRVSTGTHTVSSSYASTAA